jgi:beta-phosphoglucomutase-like phosphatase (HAD superfamily)
MPYPFKITATSLNLPPGEFAGYIFDCDGTLVDSMPLHLDAWRAALEPHGFLPANFTLEMHHNYAGMPGVAIVRDLNEKFGLALDPAQVEADKVVWYLANHAKVGPVQPVVDFARANFGKIPMAVASGSDRKLVELSLAALGLTELFPIVITPDNVGVGRGKPAPDMFLLAAELLGLAAETCLVFEDGHLGMQAAAAANMPAVWVAV